jgi:hypothetical protein
MNDFATARALTPLERLIFSAATRDPVTAEHFQALGARTIGVREFLAPAALARAAWVNARASASGTTARPDVRRPPELGHRDVVRVCPRPAPAPARGAGRRPPAGR